MVWTTEGRELLAVDKGGCFMGVVWHVQGYLQSSSCLNVKFCAPMQGVLQGPMGMQPQHCWVQVGAWSSDFVKISGPFAEPELSVKPVHPSA